jgi:hypothetical protein
MAATYQSADAVLIQHRHERPVNAATLDGMSARIATLPRPSLKL